jgi:hypothetical protein
MARQVWPMLTVLAWPFSNVLAPLFQKLCLAFLFMALLFVGLKGGLLAKQQAG